MKFRSKTTEAVALAIICMAVDIACGVAFRLVDGRWPSPSFWLSGVVVYLMVVVPTLRRSRTKASDGTST